MKLKYYLRGLGIGMIVTALILGISFSHRQGQETQTLTAGTGKHGEDGSIPGA